MKRILSILLSLTLLFSAVSFATDGSEPAVAVAGNIITVSGTAPSPGKTATLLLLLQENKGQLPSLDEALQNGENPDLGGTIAYFDETVADDSGSYCFRIEMPIDTEEADYAAIVGGSAMDGQTAAAEFRYDGIANFIKGIQAVNAAQTSEETKTALLTYGSYFQLDLSFLQNEKVIQYVCEELNKKQYSEETSEIPAVCAALLEDYNACLAYAMINFEDSAARLENYLKAKQAQLQINFDVYQNLDKSAQADVLTYIIAYTCTDITRFPAAFLDFLLLAELNHASTWSILADMTEKNQLQIGFDPSRVTSYSKKRSAGFKEMKAVLTKTKISTLEAFSAKLYEVFAAIQLPASGGTPSGSAGNGGSNGTSGRPGGVTVPVPIPTPTAKPTQPPVPAGKFTDIDGHWAQQDILYLEEKKLISGRTETAFMPEETITRAEFAVLIWRAAGSESQEFSGAFGDVSQDSWYAQAAESLASKGIVSGYGGRFSPEANITREEMAKMIVGAYEAYAAEIQPSKAPVFSDEDQISDWCLSYIEKAYEKGFLSGIPDGDGVKMDPQQQSTRAQAAKMIRVLFDSLSKNEQ